MNKSKIAPAIWRALVVHLFYPVYSFFSQGLKLHLLDRNPLFVPSVIGLIKAYGEMYLLESNHSRRYACDVGGSSSFLR